VKVTLKADVPAGVLKATDEVPLPLGAQPPQLVTLMKVLAALLEVMLTVPAPAWAVKLKLTGLPAFTTKDDGERTLTAALACGGAFAARNNPMAAISVTGSNFNTRLLFIG
jgi:hypothetical protein